MAHILKRTASILCPTLRNRLLASPITTVRFMSTEHSEETKEMLDRIIRVDHAGELGADRIYAGQMAVLGSTSVGPVIQAYVYTSVGQVGAERNLRRQVTVVQGDHCVNIIWQLEMWDEEKEHLQKFEELIPKHRVRPTFLLPLWNVAGFALGAGTAMLGKEAAMACTVAVEEVIGDHYDSQLRELYKDDPEKHKELLDVIKKFRDDELGHLDTGMQHDAEQAPLYSALSNFIKLGCKGAIWITERV